MKPWQNILLYGGGAALVVALAAIFVPAGPPDPDINSIQAEIDASAARAARDAIEHPWSYGRNSYPERDGFMYEAWVTAKDKVHQRAPYRDVPAFLMLHYEAKSGVMQAYVKLDGDGKIVCAPDNCQVPVSFDGKPAVFLYSGLGAADHSTNIVFLAEADAFLAALKTTRMLTVTLTLAGTGAQNLVFNTRNLVWKDGHEYRHPPAAKSGP